MAELQVKHHDGSVPIRAAALAHGPADQYKLIWRKWPLDRIPESHAVPLGVSHGGDGLQNTEQTSIEIVVLPGHAPAIERTEPGEVVSLVGAVFHAVREKGSCQSLC
jgi:hypothetical protein